MSTEEFENYVALMGKLLQFTPEQREQISGELQDHLQMRVADLVNEGIAKPVAISQALEEFGDAAVMAKNFQTVLKLKRRRWMMRFATYSIVGAFLAAILTMAMWPDDARFGTPNTSLAQANSQSDDSQEAAKESIPAISVASQRTLDAEDALRQVVSLEYDQRPFNEIEEDLETKTGLNFLLTSSAMDDSLGTDEPISFNLKNMPLNKALQLMLATKNAAYTIDEGVIMIISLDDADDVAWFRLKMFDCRELVKVLPKTQMSSRGYSGGAAGGGGGVFSVSTRQGIPQPKQDATAKSAASQEAELLDKKLANILGLLKAEAERNRPAPSSEQTLLDLVQTLIQPDSWQNTGQGLGQVEVVNGFLVVAQTERILREIENFVVDLEGNVLQGKRGGFKRQTSSRPANRPATAEVSSDVPSDSSSDDPFGGESGGKSHADDPFGN